MWKAGYDRINREGWNEMIKIVLWNKPSPVLMIFVCINNLKMWIDTIFFLFFLILRLLSKIYGSQVSCLTIDRNFRFTQPEVWSDNAGVRFGLRFMLYYINC